MPTGYVLGCGMSVILWRLDRAKLFFICNRALKKYIKNTVLLQILYVILIIGIAFLSTFITNKIAYDFLTAFIVIDLSNTERKTLNIQDKFSFNESISIMTKSIVCGFTAPLVYVLLLGNSLGIIFALFYIVSEDRSLPIFKYANALMSIIPSAIILIIAYTYYLYKSKSYHMDFGGDFWRNFFLNPFLNIDIAVAHIEGVSFYCYKNDGKNDYIKSYGKFHNTINKEKVRHYIGIGYGICTVIFVLFFIINLTLYKG